MTVRELAKQCKVSATIISRLCKKLGRTPTVEEVENRNKSIGRPLKWK